LSYLNWMLAGTQEQNKYWNLAYVEKKRREFKVNFNIEEAVNFGKYKGSRWIDLPIEYLRWLSENLEKGNPNKAFAQVALEYLKYDW